MLISLTPGKLLCFSLLLVFMEKGYPQCSPKYELHKKLALTAPGVKYKQ